MLTFCAVTTYAERHWAEYAQRCVETFDQHWVDVPLLTFTDAGLEAESPWLAAFKKRHAHRPTADYRMDAVRFSHKVAAIELAAVRCEVDVLIWIDADCVTHADVTPAWLERLLRDGDFAYLRRAKKYPECGFMMFRRNARGLRLIEGIVDQYRSDRLFELPEWHDSYVIDVVRARREAVGMLRTVSLSGSGERTNHPLINGPLGEKLDHLKGPRKQTGKSHARDLKVRRGEAYWQPETAATMEKRLADIRQRAAIRRAAIQTRKGY